MSDASTATETTAPTSLLGEEGAPAEAPTTDSTAVTDTDAAKTEGQGEQPAAGEAGAEDDAGADAPELELKVPEGFEVDAEAMDALKGLAKEAGLKPEHAQKLVDMHIGAQKALVERADAAIAEQAKAMQAAVKADREVGGQHFESNLKTARLALGRFGTPELVAALNESGLGNHPEMVRLLVRIGKATSEDSSAGKHSTAVATPANSEDAFLRAMYPTMHQDQG